MMVSKEPVLWLLFGCLTLRDNGPLKNLACAQRIWPFTLKREWSDPRWNRVKRDGGQIGDREVLRLHHSACDMARSFRPHSSCVTSRALILTCPLALVYKGMNAAEDGAGSRPG